MIIPTSDTADQELSSNPSKLGSLNRAMAPIFCAQCGVRALDTDRFCFRCGARILARAGTAVSNSMGPDVPMPWEVDAKEAEQPPGYASETGSVMTVTGVQQPTESPRSYPEALSSYISSQASSSGVSTRRSLPRAPVQSHFSATPYASSPLSPASPASPHRLFISSQSPVYQHPSTLQYDPYPPRAPPLPPPHHPTQLLDASGERTPAFDALASALFTALDLTYEPRGTHGLELSKMCAYERLCRDLPESAEADTPGGSLSTEMMWLHYDVVGAERISTSADPDILSYAGFSTVLAHRIGAVPDSAFAELPWALRTLGLSASFHLERTDFPRRPVPRDARVRERWLHAKRSARSAMQIAGASTNSTAKRKGQPRLNMEEWRRQVSDADKRERPE